MCPISSRDNYFRTIEFKEPDWIPCRIGLAMATWSKYRDALYDLVKRHPIIFGENASKINYDDFGIQVNNKPWKDDWGCIWRFPINGLDGQVVEHPLGDWSAIKSFKPPDPRSAKNWENVKRNMKEVKKKGELAFDGLPHGSMFMRLHYLRGFSNLMLDFAIEDPRLKGLIAMVRDYNVKYVEMLVECGVDAIAFGDDLGNQDRLPISPRVFRKYLTPAYKDIFTPAREAGIHVHFHSDGHILEVIEELVNAGVTVINPQSRANGIDNIRKICFGKICVDLDIDRQVILPYGTPEDVREHVKEVILKLGSKKGGLMIIAGCYPDAPLENIESLCRAMEEYHRYYSQIAKLE